MYDINITHPVKITFCRQCFPDAIELRIVIDSRFITLGPGEVNEEPVSRGRAKSQRWGGWKSCYQRRRASRLLETTYNTSNIALAVALLFVPIAVSNWHGG